MPLLGAWVLVSFRLQRHDEEPTYPFGTAPKGQLVYAADGTFCAQMSRPDRPPPASPDPMQCTLGEMERAFKGYIAYFGTFKVYPESCLVVHHVDGALHPNWEGQSFKRYYSLSGGQLTLKTPYILWGGEDGVVGTIRWRRPDRHGEPL